MNDNDRPTIRTAYEDRPASVPLLGLSATALAALFVGAVLAVFFGWFALHRVAVNREAQIQRTSFNFQQSQREEVLRLHGDLTRIDTQATQTSDSTQKAALGAQRAAIVTQLCHTAAGITGDRGDQLTVIIGKECR